MDIQQDQIKNLPEDLNNRIKKDGSTPFTAPQTGVPATQPNELATLSQVNAASGGQVDSVTGDSVDNSDPVNPIINAIPLSGTEVGSPVTGDIEFDGYVGNALYFPDPNNPSNYGAIFNEDGTTELVGSNGTYTKNFEFNGDNVDSFLMSGNSPSFKGFQGASYYGANYDNNTYVQKKYVDDNFQPIGFSTLSLQDVMLIDPNSTIDESFFIQVDGTSGGDSHAIYVNKDSETVIESVLSNNTSRVACRIESVDLIQSNLSNYAKLSLVSSTIRLQTGTNYSSYIAINTNEVTGTYDFTMPNGNVDLFTGATGDVLTKQADGSLVLQTPTGSGDIPDLQDVFDQSMINDGYIYTNTVGFARFIMVGASGSKLAELGLYPDSETFISYGTFTKIGINDNSIFLSHGVSGNRLEFKLNKLTNTYDFYRPLSSTSPIFSIDVTDGAAPFRKLKPGSGNAGDVLTVQSNGDLIFQPIGGGSGGQVDSVQGTMGEIEVTGTATDPIVGLAQAAKDSLALADSALQPGDEFSGDYNDLTNKPDLTPYVKKDGSVPFTAPQKGVAAVNDDELTTLGQIGEILSPECGDGIWYAITSPELTSWNSIATDGNGVWIAVSSGGINRIMRSDDNGLTWSAIAAPEQNSWYSIATNRQGTWIAVSTGGTNRIMRSNDNGLTWSSIAAPEQNSWYSIATDESGVWVAVSQNGTNRIMRSNDNGLSWYAIAATEQNAWKSIATDGNGVWIAVAASGTNRIMRSDDNGLTWSSIASPEQKFWKSIATDGNGVWIAVSEVGGSTNQIMRSSDNGLTWSAIVSPEQNYWYSIATDGNGVWVAVSEEGSGTNLIMRSDDDGLSWYAIAATEKNIWNSIATDGNGVWVAVSADGDGTNLIMRLHEGCPLKYVKDDGSTPFKAPQTGVPGTDPNHLATVSQLTSGGGLTESDLINTLRSFSKPQWLDVASLTAVSNVFTPDLGVSGSFAADIGANSTLANPTIPSGYDSGKVLAWDITFTITGAGGWTLAFGNQYFVDADVDIAAIIADNSTTGDVIQLFFQFKNNAISVQPFIPTAI